MKTLDILIRRNTKLFFRDKGNCFGALIAPLILLFLFVTFLGSVYRDSFTSTLPEGMVVESALMEGFVGGWLMSSLLAVCCVTVAFSANMIMVQDQVTGVRGDLTIAPIKSSTLSLSYYLSTALVTGVICLIATGVGLLYLGQVGWYLSTSDVLYILLDVFLLVLFGTALSSIVCALLNSQGGITAVTTIVSAAYGFLCGAYMPITSLSDGIQGFIKCLPGTYGTSLLHNHFMGGCYAALEKTGFPAEAVLELKKGFDTALYVQGNLVEIPQMYAITAAAVVVLVLVYLLMNKRRTA